MLIGIVGKANVGKSTLFKALTRKPVDIAPYPFTTINPNVGIVQVPDERLKKIAEIIKPEKITPTIIDFVDIAGLVKGAHKGEGLGNQFLAQIRNCDAVLEVVRVFAGENIENVLGEINPEKEKEVIRTELLMKDLETIENALLKLEKKQDKDSFKKTEILKKTKEAALAGKSVSEIDLSDDEKKEIKEYQFLTEKPFLYVLNFSGGNPEFSGLKFNYLAINLKEEEELSELSGKELEELGASSEFDKLILNCYNTLDLITFYTIAGGKEARAWTVARNSKVVKAGGVVHSDFEEKFIRAEVLNWKALSETGSWQKAKESGLLKTVGRDYIVQDGDIIEFKI